MPIQCRPTRGKGYLENFLARKRAELANRLIPKSVREGRLLDIGCGNDPFFLRLTPFHEKYGLDQTVPPQGRLIQPGNIRLCNFNFESTQEIPFSGEYFEVVTMLAVFEHIYPKNLLTILNEVYRVLKPGGLYIDYSCCLGRRSVEISCQIRVSESDRN